ncbi:Rrf2 family transcriptional regulator [Bradyrhizobium sp. LA6.12]|uniref:RrF2 family transcriptional regulator n=1 Tax=unclassified Bradyrhizobium TaxID=2631580 RepID=UPI00339A55F3
MAHITTGVEYGLHCLLYLVEPLDESQPASVRALAELQGVSVEYVAKLFTKLQKAGLVVATEGARGGFRLARPARSISVLDVITAIDGEKPIFECRDIRAQCAVFGGKRPAWSTRGVCSIHAIMLEADARMRKVLASRTVADIASMVTKKVPAEYMQKLEKWFEERAPTSRNGG